MRACSWRLAVVVSAFIFLPQLAQAGEPTAAEVLDNVRAAMAARDLPGAKAALDGFDKARGDQRSKIHRERLTVLLEYLTEFWKAVDEGAKRMRAGEEITINDVSAAVVEYTNGMLVLKAGGRNRHYTLKTLPPRVALFLAQKVMKKDEPQNKIFFGTFLLMDARGDRVLAEKLWSEAEAAKVDTLGIVGELDVPLVARVNLEIPPLDAAMKKILAPKGWQLATAKTGKLVRGPLGEIAEQDEEGYLRVVIPKEGAAESQLMLDKKLIGNFGCRVVLRDVREGQSFGLYSAGDTDAGYEVELPKGDAKIEFARQGLKFICLINGKETPVTPRGEATPKMPGMLGVRVPADSSVLVAWFQLKVK